MTKPLSQQAQDEAYDLLVALHNTLIDKGFDEPEILQMILGWVSSSIETAKEYGYHNDRYPAPPFSSNENKYLTEKLENAKALLEVQSGKWCLENRKEGRGGCGMCAWCFKEVYERACAAEVKLASLTNPSEIEVVTTCASCGDQRTRDTMHWDAECNYPGPFCQKCGSHELRVK